MRNLLAKTLFALLLLANAAFAADPLPSWNDGPAKQSIINFVTKVTKAGSPDFVPEPERIATFDNDGTLWSEQPMYFQLLFAVDRVKARRRCRRCSRRGSGWASGPIRSPAWRRWTCWPRPGPRGRWPDSARRRRSV